MNIVMRIGCAILLCTLAQGSIAAAWAEADQAAGTKGSRDQGVAPSSGPDRVFATVEITDADRLAVRVQDHPELTGEYRVGPDGAISVPVIGRFNVGSQTPAQLEKVLAKKAGEIAGREVYVTVEIAAYKPVFVTGLVKNAGSVQWFPGMAILQAVAMSGGIQVHGAQAILGESPAAEFNDLARYKKALEGAKRSIAVLARVRAEQRGVSVIEVPDQLLKLAGPKEAEQLIKAQTVLLESRRKSLEGQLGSLERGRVLAGQELTGLKEQSLRTAELLRLRRDASQKLQDLFSKGIVPRERTFEEAIKVAELEEKGTNTAVAIARVQATVATLERETVTMQAERQAQLEAEALNLEGEITQLSVEFEMGRQRSGNTMPGESGSEVFFTLVRRIGGEQKVITADQSTLVRPGDVVMVARVSQPSGQPERSE